ncbi:MAG: hypothetical protein EZS28_027823, partial [Streblomastix strix]
RISLPAQQKPAQLQSQQVSEPQLLKPRISPPPNPNCTKVRFSGIPEQSLYEEVKNLTHQFGEVKKDSFQYHKQDESREGFAIVEYLTHQIAESAVKSSDEKRKIRGVIVRVQWDTQQNEISSTSPPQPKLQSNQRVYIHEQSQISSSETNTRQYSPPPNTNIKRVHFAGIPIESSELEVKAFARQFGLYTSYDDGRTGFANVEYQTHEQAQAAVASNMKNMLNGEPISIYWSNNQQFGQDDDYFESGRNAVLFQGFGFAQKRSKMMEYVKRFGPIQKFLSPHMPQTQQQIRDQGFQTALVEYIDKEDMERAIESSGSDFEGFKLNICESTFREDQNDNKQKTKHPKVDDQKNIRKYKKPKPQIIEEIKEKIGQKRQKLNQLESEYNEKIEFQKMKDNMKEKLKKGEERLDLEGVSPIIEFRWLHDSVNEKIIRKQIKEYCDENDKDIGEIEYIKVFQYEVHKRAHIEFESPEIDPDSKQLIEGIQVRKLRRGINRNDLMKKFRKYNPIKFFIHVDLMDPRYDFAFIPIPNPNQSIAAVNDTDQTEFGGHKISVQLKYRFMPSEKFKKLSEDEKPKYKYILLTNFENDFTLEEFLELLEDNHIEAQGGLVTLEVDDPKSCLAIAYILDQIMPLENQTIHIMIRGCMKNYNI